MPSPRLQVRFERAIVFPRFRRLARRATSYVGHDLPQALFEILKYFSSFGVIYKFNRFKSCSRGRLPPKFHQFFFHRPNFAETVLLDTPLSRVFFASIFHSFGGGRRGEAHGGYPIKILIGTNLGCVRMYKAIQVNRSLASLSQ